MPAAKRTLPRIAKAVTRVTPHLTRGVGKITRVLHRHPAARPLLRAVPAIARRTVHTIARQAAHGRPVTPRTAVRTLAQHTRQVLGSPRHRAHALRGNQRMDRQFHRRVGKRMALPHWRYAGRPVVGGVARAAVPGAPMTYAAGRVAPLSRFEPSPARGARCGKFATSADGPAWLHVSPVEEVCVRHVPFAGRLWSPQPPPLRPLTAAAAGRS